MKKLIGLGLSLVLLASSTGQLSAIAQDGARKPPPGEGVLCAWSIMAAIAEIGRKCHAGEDVELQGKLDGAVARIDAYVLANSDPATTRAQIEEFKRIQGHNDVPAGKMCVPGDGEIMYQEFARAEPDMIRTWLDELLARPGNPSWGTCL